MPRQTLTAKCLHVAAVSLQIPSVGPRRTHTCGAGYGKPVVIQVLESLFRWIPASGTATLTDGLGQTSLTVTTGWDWTSGALELFLHRVHRAGCEVSTSSPWASPFSAANKTVCLHSSVRRRRPVNHTHGLLVTCPVEKPTRANNFQPGICGPRGEKEGCSSHRIPPLSLRGGARGEATTVWSLRGYSLRCCMPNHFGREATGSIRRSYPFAYARNSRPQRQAAPPSRGIGWTGLLEIYWPVSIYIPRTLRVRRGCSTSRRLSHRETI